MTEEAIPITDLDRLRHLDRLRRRRAYKRGQITKIHKKLLDIQDKHPDSINIYDVNRLSGELQSAIAVHDSYQSKIEDLVQDVEDATFTEEQERDKHHDLHGELNQSFCMLKDYLPLWNSSKSLIHDMDSALEESVTDSPHFRSSGDSILSRCSDFYCRADPLSGDNSYLQERVQYLKDKSKLLITAIRNVYKDPTPSLPTSPVPATPSSSTPHGATLHIEVPTFWRPPPMAAV